MELICNKLYSLTLIAIGILVTVLDGDATALVLLLFFAVPMFFAKESWIL